MRSCERTGYGDEAKASDAKGLQDDGTRQTAGGSHTPHQATVQTFICIWGRSSLGLRADAAAAAWWARIRGRVSYVVWWSVEYILTALPSDWRLATGEWRLAADTLTRGRAARRLPPHRGGLLGSAEARWAAAMMYDVQMPMD